MKRRSALWVVDLSTLAQPYGDFLVFSKHLHIPSHESLGLVFDLVDFLLGDYETYCEQHPDDYAYYDVLMRDAIVRLFDQHLEAGEFPDDVVASVLRNRHDFIRSLESVVMGVLRVIPTGTCQIEYLGVYRHPHAWTLIYQVLP